MKPPKYDGNIHPNEWLKQIQIYCFLKQIIEEKDTLTLAKTMIDTSIIIPESVTSLDELINTLKQNNSFLIFKVSRKRKLQVLKYQMEKDDIAKFVTEFRTLCRDAEIIDLEEQKKNFIQALPTNCVNLFAKIQVHSMNELFKEFNDFVLDYPNLIKNNSCVALKHVSTGKYLSSSNKQVVYCGDTVLNNNNALWIINTNDFTNFITDQNSITLKHKSSKNYLSISKGSSNTANYKVGCNNEGDIWTLQLSKNGRNYLKSQDTVLLKTSFGSVNLTLRSHEINFELDNKNYQEVLVHENRIGGIDEWSIELIE